jgi:hypothetical protein
VRLQPRGASGSDSLRVCYKAGEAIATESELRGVGDGMPTGRRPAVQRESLATEREHQRPGECWCVVAGSKLDGVPAGVPCLPHGGESRLAL